MIGQRIRFAAVMAAEWAGWLDFVDGSIVASYLNAKSNRRASSRELETLEKWRKTTRAAARSELDARTADRVFAFAAVAAAVVILLQAGVIGKLMLQARSDDSGSSFETAGASGAANTIY